MEEHENGSPQANTTNPTFVNVNCPPAGIPLSLYQYNTSNPSHLSTSTYTNQGPPHKKLRPSPINTSLERNGNSSSSNNLATNPNTNTNVNSFAQFQSNPTFTPAPITSNIKSLMATTSNNYQNMPSSSGNGINHSLIPPPMAMMPQLQNQTTYNSNIGNTILDSIPSHASTQILTLGLKAQTDLTALIQLLQTTDSSLLHTSQLNFALSIVQSFTKNLGTPPSFLSTFDKTPSYNNTAAQPNMRTPPINTINTNPIPQQFQIPQQKQQRSTASTYQTLVSPQKIQTLNDFILLQTLGTGTFGKVRLCKDKKSGRYFCVKILSKDKVVRLKQTEHVKSERYILSQVHHPFIVKLYNTFQDSANLYLLLEYIPGGELFSYIRKRGGLDNQTVKFYSAEIVLAIRYLHSLNIAHRDLKPENLLLSAEGHLKLTDFGFAKQIVDKTWTMCGTPEYIAPEVILSKGHDKSVDWWSLGVLIYEMLAGKPPFCGEHTFNIFEKILAKRPIDIPHHFDPHAQDLIFKLLVADTTKRLGSARNGGVEEVMRHPYFAGLDWDALFRKELKPPITPALLAEGDTTNFARYSEEKSEVTVEFTGGDLFKDF